MRYSILLLIFSFLFTVGCDSFLDDNPDDRQEIKTVEDVAELVASAYHQATFLFVEWMTDNVGPIENNAQKEYMTEAYLWDPIDSYESQESSTFFWEQAYYAIAHTNEGLSVIDKVEGDDNLRKAIKGEALIARAYSHFLLVNVFAKHYNLKTSNNDLGIPYSDEVEDELFKKYTRLSVQEVYDLIERDIKDGLKLLSDDYFAGSKKYHFTREAAYAFAARFYLFKQEYDKCKFYCDKILGSGSANPAYVRDLNQIYQGTSFSSMASKFSSPDELSNILLIRKESFYARANYGYRSDADKFTEIFSNNIQKEFDNRDQRWNLGTYAVFSPKYDELFQYTTSNTGYPYFIQTELRGEEVILNRMECMIMEGNYTKALDDYHVLAEKRYESGGILVLDSIKKFYSKEDAKEAMISFLIDERRKEFLDEGLRWFDIKRFALSVQHTTLNEESFHLAANDNKTAVQIPQKAITNGITPNPR